MKNFTGKAGLIVVLLLCFQGWAFAEDKGDGMALLKENIQKFAPGMQPDTIAPSPIPGLYEVVIGPRLFYFSADGQYLVEGSIYNVKTKEDMTEGRTAAARMKAINDLGDENMLVFAPTEAAKYTVTVFTDTDCSYCQRLHSEMDEYNKLGIKVRYLFYPLRSPVSKAVSVWCAEDPQKAMTEAKAGKQIKQAECDNPVQKHIVLGRMMGLSGTPALITDNGTMIPGYLPPKKLLKRLQKLSM
jgi:thiol:disulfide interchange protein DsbC